MDNITDFTVGAGGDVLDISDLLVGAGISPTDFVGAESNYLIVMPGANTTIAFDADGVGGAAAVQIATLTGVNTNLPALLSAGQIDRTP